MNVKALVQRLGGNKELKREISEIGARCLNEDKMMTTEEEFKVLKNTEFKQNLKTRFSAFSVEVLKLNLYSFYRED